MEYFLSAFWATLELIALHYFWNAFLEVKVSRKYYLISFATAWIFSVLFLNIGIADTYERAISFAMFITIAFVCYRGLLARKILVVMLFFVSGAVIDTAITYGTSAVLGISLSELVWRKATYTVAVTVGKLIIIFVAWIMCRIQRTWAHEPIRQKWLLLTVLFPAVSLGMLVLLFHSNRETEDLSFGSLCFSIMLTFANIAIIYLLNLMEKNAAETKLLALLKQQMDIQTNSILALERNYRAQRKVTHDHRNQIQTVYDLLLAGEYKAAQSYVRQLQGMQTTRIFTINSHHPIIDAVLNQKYQLAQENDIDLRIKVNDLSGVSIPTDSLVVLLSNVLDNAIEACLRLPDNRIIQCSIITTDSVYISVRNTSIPVEIKDNFIPTSKEPKEDHGYGLPHIDFILKQLHAEYVLSYEGGWFEFATEIPKN